MVKVIEVDEKNEPVRCHEAEVVIAPGCDVITLRQGVPALGSAEFEAWLQEWHEIHNPGLMGVSA